MTETKNNDERFPEVKPTKPGNDTAYIAPIIGKLGYDTRRPWLFGLGTSPNNGVDFHVFLSFDGLNFDDNDIDKIWSNGAADKVKKEVDSATAEIPAAVSAANSAVSAAESAVAASKVNSDAIVAQSEAISEAKSAMDSATAEIQQTAANAASDADSIRADVASVQNEVDTAKAANSASIEALKSDVSAAKQDLADVHDSLTKAQAAAEESQKAIDKSIDQINSDIEQGRKDIASAQQANADTAKQLDTYSKQAQDQGKTIKSIQDKQDGFTATLADVQGNVTQVSDKVDGLSASLKDAQGNVASVKAQADQLSATLTDHSKDIANLTATAKGLSSTLEDASGRLSKVEQTASEQSTTLSDVQGNLSQVKQTADGLVTTLKDAQGNIDQIKQTAKGTAEQLSNAQGDITALQKDVDGIKLTIADHDKNIHTLQADSKSLQDDMEDAKGNISTLQKTSTSITSELKDHDGRMSKVEQTASTLTNEFSDQQGHLNRVEQTANGTQQTVANQQGQINTIKTDASGIHETLTGQGNQIAKINVTVNSLKSQYEGVSGDLDKLKDANQWKVVNGAFDANQYIQTASIFYQDKQAKNTPDPGWFYFIVEAPTPDRITQNLIKDNSDDSWSRFCSNGQWSAWTKGVSHLDIDSLSNKVQTNSTQITQNKKEIDLKASQDTVDNLTGEVSQTKAQLKVQADQISSKVSSEDFKTLDNKVGGAIAQIQKNATAIDQTNKQISLKADQTEVDKIKNTATQNSSRLNIMAGEISSKVTSTDVNNIVDKKGYATTSTVQSLITQKAGTINESITNLDAKYKDKDGVNLVRASGFHNVTLDELKNSGWSLYDKAWINKNGGSNKQGSIVIDATSITTGVEDIVQTITLEPDTDYTLSFHLIYESTISGKSFNAWSYVVEEDSNGNAVSPYVDHNCPMANSDDRKQNTRTFHTSKDTHQGVLYLRAMAGTKVELEEVKLEHGSVATPWTPAPSDNATVTQVQQITASIDGLQSTVANKADKSQITQLSNLIQSKVSTDDFNNLRKAVDLQTLDSADINSMKTNGHYFVRNLANNPVGGWVYVDVTGNGNDRIRQDVYQDNGNDHKYRRWFGSYWTGWDEGANYSEITQLRDDINLRVKKGDLLSQINIDAGHTLIQSNKIYLAAGNVVFSNSAFIPSAAIENLDASKLTFYGPYNAYATIGSSVAQYDDDKQKNTINLQYNGGVELHSSNELGSILTMHDDTVRLAVKSQVYGSGSGQPVNQQYSGVWFGKNYTLMNSVDREGRTTGISIGSTPGKGVNGTYRCYIYDGSSDIQQTYGVGIGTPRFNVSVGDSDTKLNIAPGTAELRSQNETALHGNNEAWIEGGNQQFYMHNGEIVANNMSGNSSTGVHLIVHGWATYDGYVEAMGWTTKSTLSSKTRIQPLDTAKALATVNATDLTTFLYTAEVAEGMTKRHAGPVIDDVHDVAQYNTPDAFVAENRQGRSDADIIGYLMGAVQELSKQLNEVKEKI